jgi:hypothetical protein
VLANPFILDRILLHYNQHNVELHHFYVAPAPGENFNAAPAALAPTLLYSKAKFLKRTKVHMLELSSSFDSVRFILLKT